MFLKLSFNLIKVEFYLCLITQERSSSQPRFLKQMIISLTFYPSQKKPIFYLSYHHSSLQHWTLVPQTPSEEQFCWNIQEFWLFQRKKGRKTQKCDNYHTFFILWWLLGNIWAWALIDGNISNSNIQDSW